MVWLNCPSMGFLNCGASDSRGRLGLMPHVAEADQSQQETSSVGGVDDCECGRYETKHARPAGAIDGCGDVAGSVEGGDCGHCPAAKHRKGSAERETSQCQHECRGHEVAQAHLAGILLHHPHLPVTILEVLLPQRSSVAAVIVNGRDGRCEQYPVAPGRDPIVEFIVLIPDLLLVEPTYLVEDLAAPRAHVDRVDPFFLLGIVKPRPADTERRRG